MRTLIVMLAVVALHLASAAAAEPRPPEVHVTISNADSPGDLDIATVKQVFLDTLANTSRVATSGHFDVSVVKLHVATVGRYVEIAIEVHVVVSDRDGRILAFASGGATAQVPHHSFRPSQLPQLRKQALEDATSGMLGSLRARAVRATS